MVELFGKMNRIQCRAIFVGERLELRDFEKAQRLASSPLILTAGSQGCAVLFRYGVVVLFGLSAVEEVTFLSSLEAFVIIPFEKTERDEVVLLADADQVEGIDGGNIILHEFSLERLQLVAEVLAKSVVLGHYEANIAESFKRIEPLAEMLQKHGRPGSKGRQLLRHIGDTLSIQGRMVGRVEISEKPELLWNYPEYERLYLRLEDEYELSERHLALERKLDLINRTAETMLGLLQNRRSLRVEWYITLLIVLEILLTLYQMLTGSHG